MQIDLNGTPVVTRATTLAALITEQSFDAASVATAMDGQFVPRPARAATSLHPGARIEVLAPMQGG